MLPSKFHIALSSIETLVGIFAFVYFCIVYDNTEVGLCALFSGIYSGSNAALGLMLYCHYNANLSRKALEYFGDFGLIGFVVGSALLLFYVFSEIVYEADILSIQISTVIRIVWSFMMLKWGLLLFIVIRYYLQTFDESDKYSENAKNQKK